MGSDALDLLVHVGDAFATIFRHGPSFGARLTGESWVVSAGEEHCFWNWVALASASPANRATLRGAVQRFREARVDGLLYYPPEAEAPLAAAFRELGLDAAGLIPLMTCDPADLSPPERAHVAVARVSSATELAEAMAVMAAGFEIPPDQVLRTFNAGLLDEPAVTVYAARRDRSILGMLALTRFGGTVSIDLMATDPAAQRQGIGRALMLAAMHQQLVAGVTGFHLMSSPDGQRLYEQLGFRTVLPALTRLIPVDPIPPDQVVT